MKFGKTAIASINKICKVTFDLIKDKTFYTG